MAGIREEVAWSHVGRDRNVCVERGDGLVDTLAESFKLRKGSL